MKKKLYNDDDRNLFILLAQVRHLVVRARNKELKTYGLTSMYAMVLFVVQAIGTKATPATISQWTLRESQTISDLLRRMEKKGLVRLTKDLARKNQIRVSLTRKGKLAYERSINRRSINNVISSLSTEEKQQLGSYLRKMRQVALEQLRIELIPPFPIISNV